MPTAAVKKNCFTIKIKNLCLQNYFEYIFCPLINEIFPINANTNTNIKAKKNYVKESTAILSQIVEKKKKSCYLLYISFCFSWFFSSTVVGAWLPGIH